MPPTLSDKFFWHKYIDFYESFFAQRDFQAIAEVGVLTGQSIRWLLDRFPRAQIHGADILPLQPDWPVDDRFHFTQLDQGNVVDLRRFLSQQRFDLIIEDGSHIPAHQALCLVTGMNALASGGIYILEDIHTSHPGYAGNTSPANTFQGNALTVLLAIGHYKRVGHSIGSREANLIAQDAILDSSDVLALAENIQAISLYRRTTLPDHCYRCGSKEYRFSQLECVCGERIFADADSMTAVIQKV